MSENPLPKEGALLFKRCGCRGAKDAVTLMLKGWKIAKAPCTACRYGLWLLVPRICNNDPPDEWPDGAIQLAAGVYAVPNAEEYRWEEHLTFPVEVDDGVFVGFRPVGTYDTEEEVRYVAAHWAELLRQYLAGARSRLGTFHEFDGIHWVDIHCPGDHGAYPPGGSEETDFSGFGDGDEIDLSIASGEYQGTCPTELEPGTYATFNWHIALDADASDLCRFEVCGSEVFLSQSGNRYWEASGTVSVEPCECFRIEAFYNLNHAGSDSGCINVSWERDDCPDMSPAAIAAWEEVLEGMDGIPMDSEALCEYRRGQALLAEMGE